MASSIRRWATPRLRSTTLAAAGRHVTSVGGQAELPYNANSTQPYFLKVSGVNPQVALNSYLSSPAVVTNVPPTPNSNSPSATTSHHNTVNPFDVNGDGIVSALDALVVINELNATQGGPLEQP